MESEREVEDNLNTLFERNPFDFILVKYDRIDWDRFRTFSHVAKRYGWKYIITEMDAYFYYLLNKDAVHKTMRDPNVLRDEHIYVLKQGDARYEWQESIRQVVYEYNQEHRFLSYRDLKQLNGKYIVYLTYLSSFLTNNLNFDLKGLFITSAIDPYAEEFFDNIDTIKNRLAQFGIPSYRIHASGHATPHDLINFIEETNPELLIPIHTKNPEFFEKLFKNSEIKVILPEKNSQMSV